MAYCDFLINIHMQNLQVLIDRLQSAVDEGVVEKLSINDLEIILTHFKRVQSAYQAVMNKQKEKHDETS
jgi:hypothetical protein